MIDRKYKYTSDLLEFQECTPSGVTSGYKLGFMGSSLFQMLSWWQVKLKGHPDRSLLKVGLYRNSELASSMGTVRQARICFW